MTTANLLFLSADNSENILDEENSMKRIYVCLLLVGLMATAASGRQVPTQRQRLNFKIGIPRGQRARLILPYSNSIELSALNMERNDELVMHLKGAVEMKFANAP